MTCDLRSAATVFVWKGRGQVEVRGVRLAREASDIEGDKPRMVVGGRYPSLHERLQERPCLTRRQELAPVLTEKLVLGEHLAGRRRQLGDIGIAPIESDYVASRHERPDLTVRPHTRR